MSTQAEAFRSPVVGQFQLVLPPSADADALSRTPVSSVVHVSSTLTESVFGTAAYTHQFTCGDTAFVNKYLRLASAVVTPKALFRMGLIQGDGYWYPWQEHVLVAHSAEPLGRDGCSGHRLAISTQDLSYAMDRSSKTIARRGTISDIVAAIAGENGIESTVIEPTDGEGVYIQSFQSDTEFIRKRLLPRALNRKGSGGYFFFFRDGALHFHTLDYNAGVKTFDFYDNNQVLLTSTDHSQQLFDDGIAGTRFIAHDPYTAQVQEVTSSPADAPRLADVLNPTSSVTNAQLNVPYHLGPNPPSEVGAMAQYAYSVARLRAYDLLLTFNGIADVRVGDIIDLTVRQESRAASPFSGLYFVTQVVYKIVDKTLTIITTLNRGETARLSTDTLVSASSSRLVLDPNGQDQAVPAMTAPGRTININELGSSPLTTGSSSQTSRTVVVPVRDGANG